MSRISAEEVEYTAHLARIELSADERATMTRDLDRVLDYVAALQELDTEGIEPTYHPIPVPTPLRADDPETPIDPALAVSNAPHAEGTAFVVPKVIDSEDEG